MARASREKTARGMSECCNFVDERVMLDAYLALERLIRRELRESGRIILPGIGTIKMARTRRTGFTGRDGEFVSTSGVVYPRFAASAELKELVRTMAFVDPNVKLPRKGAPRGRSISENL